ncbi:MAG: TonB-dependent receptor [Cellvibrionaceae bacterium]
MKTQLLQLSLLAMISTHLDALEGKVSDSAGKPIAGASVEVIGKSLSVTTDEQGQFTVDIDTTTELHIEAEGFTHKTIHLHADDLNTQQNIVLSKSLIQQMDIVGIPIHVSNLESAIPVNVLSGEQLREKQAATLGDTLANEVGIHTNFHGNVASTPVIRGLSGPRVLITQNSLDVSDASRVGPDHSVAAEASTAERLEVLRGPATLFFGSGAVGGVVNVVDKRVPTDTETTAEWLISHDTVNEQDLASFNLNTAKGNWAFHADAFIRESNNYEVPVSPEIDEDHGERSVDNTAEDSEGFTLGTSYILDNGYIGLSYGELDRDYGIPGHSHGEEEHEEEGHEEEAYEDHEGEKVTLGMKQERLQLISELSFNHNLISGFNTRIGRTDYEHTEFEDGIVGTTFANETTEIKLELLHQPLSDWNGGIVFDYKNSDFAAVGDEAFAPASETNTFAIAIIEEHHFGNVLLQLGARIERVNIKSNDVSIAEVEFHHHDEEPPHEEEEEQKAETFSFDEDYNPFSLSVGTVWDFAPGYNVGISFSHSERAPSAAELLSYGPHIATNTFEIGALFEAHEEDEEIHFEPTAGTADMEKSNNIDITFRKFEGDVGLILNAFYNQVDNYYAQFDTELFAEAGHGHEEEGAEEEEAHDEHAEELPVYLFQNDDVTLRGFEAQTVWQVNFNVKAEFFADYVRAKLDNGGNLPRIPPMRYGASLEYVQDRLSATLSWTHYSDQDNTTELETETDGYDWINASVNYRIPLENTDLTLFVKGENLSDEEARVHSSFLKDLAPRPGRNFRLGIRGNF